MMVNYHLLFGLDQQYINHFDQGAADDEPLLE